MVGNITFFVIFAIFDLSLLTLVTFYIQTAVWLSLTSLAVTSRNQPMIVERQTGLR